jgi:hypothetical protein
MIEEKRCLKSLCQHGPERLTIQIVASLCPCCHYLKAPPFDSRFARDFKQDKNLKGFQGGGKEENAERVEWRKRLRREVRSRRPEVGGQGIHPDRVSRIASSRNCDTVQERDMRALGVSPWH